MVPNRVPNCRHIKTDNTQCGSPAIKDQLFCFNHKRVRRALAQIAPVPDPYGWDRKPLPLVFSEDRAALQLNYSLVMAAVLAGRMNIQTANCLNRILRSCEINLTHGPLTAPGAHAVHNVVLTPEGEEIAPPEEDLEELAVPASPESGCPISRRDVGEDALDPSTAKHTRLDGQSPAVPQQKIVIPAEASEGSNEAASFLPLPASSPRAIDDPSYLENRRGLQAAIRSQHLAAYAAGLEPPPPFPPPPAAEIVCPGPIEGAKEKIASASSADAKLRYPTQSQFVPRSDLEAAYYGLPWPLPEPAHPLTA